jgi:hypothetical protein
MIEEFNINYKGSIVKLSIYQDNSIWYYLIELPGLMIGSEQKTDCKSKIEIINLAIADICDNDESDIKILRREILISEIFDLT